MSDREMDWLTGLFTIHTLDNKKISMAAALISEKTGPENKELWNSLQEQSKKHNYQSQYISSLNNAIKYAQISLDYYEFFLTRVNEIARQIGFIMQSRIEGQLKENACNLENLKEERIQAFDLVFYFNQNYVSGMKRIYERLEHFNNTKSAFPEPIAETIKLVRRKKKSILEKYIGARDFNEHQSEILHKEKNPFTEVNNIVMGEYHASNNPKHQVILSRDDLASILAGQIEIFQSIEKQANICKLELDRIFQNRIS